VNDHGTAAIDRFHERYSHLSSTRYDRLDFPSALKNADLVLVHEWNSPELVRCIGEHRPSNSVLLFHDTHHRAVTCPEAMADYDLSGYDGVLAFGNVIREIYLQRGWARRAWTWHEAADTSVFHPLPRNDNPGDLVWIGNWGDDERTSELEEFLIRPVKQLGLNACVYGVRYPRKAKERLAQAGIEYRGWLPNDTVPEIFSQFKATIHIPRRPYVISLPGIPTIRPFEAMACGIPLVSAPWTDSEQMFTAGSDFLVAADGGEMAAHLATILNDPATANRLASHGLNTIRERHTCAHRIDELLGIYQEITGIYG
jgi:spore maturation protein CgeB